VGTRCADHVTPLYPQKLALTSPTGGGRSVGIVRVRTKATESFYLLCVKLVIYKDHTRMQVQQNIKFERWLFIVRIRPNTQTKSAEEIWIC